MLGWNCMRNFIAFLLLALFNFTFAQTAPPAQIYINGLSCAPPGTNGAILCQFQGIPGPIGPAGPQGPQGIPGSTTGSQLLSAPIQSTTIGSASTKFGIFGYYAMFQTLYLPYTATVVPQGGTLSNLCVSVWGNTQPTSGPLSVSIVYSNPNSTTMQTSPMLVTIAAGATNGVYCNSVNTQTVAPGSAIAIRAVNAATATSTGIGGVSAKFSGN